MTPIVLGLGQSSAPAPEPVSISARVASITDGTTAFPDVSWRDLEDSLYPRDTSGRPNSMNLRFAGLEIPRNATIQSARISLWGAGNRTGADATDFFTIGAEQVDDATSIPTSPSNGLAAHISRMSNVGTTVVWSLSNHTNNQLVQSPELAAVVQQIVNRPGWPDGSGGAIMFFTQNNSGTNSGWNYEPGFQSYAVNNGAQYLPLLEVTYLA